MNVLEISLQRIKDCFLNFDTVVVAYSGGKDSGIVLNLALKVASELGVKLNVYFYDIEVIEPSTEALLTKVANNPLVQMYWTTLQTVHKNACSTFNPFWISWDESKKGLWFRKKPLGTIDFFPNASPTYWHRASDQPWLFPSGQYGSVMVMRGFRAEESIRRRHLINCNRRHGFDSYQSTSPTSFDYYGDRNFCQTFTRRFNHIYSCQPIWDWSTNDVWLAYKQLGWDYNRAYDQLSLSGLSLAKQRVSNPYGVEGANKLYLWKEGYPHLWDKFCDRVDGVYETYLYNVYEPAELTDDLDYPSEILTRLKQLPSQTRDKYIKNLLSAITYHQGKTNRPIHGHVRDPISNMSWRLFYRSIARGDFSGRILEQEKQLALPDSLKDLKLTLKQANELGDKALTFLFNQYLESLPVAKDSV